MPEFIIRRESQIYDGSIPRNTRFVVFEGIAPTAKRLQALKKRLGQIEAAIIPQHHASSVGAKSKEIAEKNGLKLHIEDATKYEEFLERKFAEFRRQAEALEDKTKSDELERAIALFKTNATHREKVLLATAFQLGSNTKYNDLLVPDSQKREKEVGFAIGSINFVARLDLRKLFEASVKKGNENLVSSRAFQLSVGYLGPEHSLSHHDADHLLRPIYLGKTLANVSFFNNKDGEKSELSIAQVQGVEGFNIFGRGVVSPEMEEHKKNINWKRLSFSLMEVLAAAAGRPTISSIGAATATAWGNIQMDAAKQIYDFPERLKWKGHPSRDYPQHVGSWTKEPDRKELLKKYGRELKP